MFLTSFNACIVAHVMSPPPPQSTNTHTHSHNRWSDRFVCLFASWYTCTLKQTFLPKKSNEIRIGWKRNKESVRCVVRPNCVIHITNIGRHIDFNTISFGLSFCSQQQNKIFNKVQKHHSFDADADACAQFATVTDSSSMQIRKQQIVYTKKKIAIQFVNIILIVEEKKNSCTRTTQQFVGVHSIRVDSAVHWIDRQELTAEQWTCNKMVKIMTTQMRVLFHAFVRERGALFVPAHNE